jgi:AraC family transcriptional regulator, activator of mtrCDE
MQRDPLLDQLLATVDVAIEDLSACEIAQGVLMNGGIHPTIDAHYVVEGVLQFEMSDGPPLICGAGSVLVVPPNTEQMLSVAPARRHGRPGAEFGGQVSVRMPPAAANDGGNSLRMISGRITANIAGSFGLLDAFRKPIVVELGDRPFVEQAYQMMLREMTEPELGSRAVAVSLMKACLLILLRQHFSMVGNGTVMFGALSDQRLGRSVVSVVDSPSARHSVAGLAATAGMSRSAFAREFTQTFAISPMSFVTRTRLNLSTDMLANSRLPIKSIAAAVGFSSRSHFSRAFRVAYGLDPTSYRRQAMADSLFRTAGKEKRVQRLSGVNAHT